MGNFIVTTQRRPLGCGSLPRADGGKAAPPISAYEAWFTEEGLKATNTFNPSRYRMMAVARRSGTPFATIAAALNKTPEAVYKAFKKLPEHLR